MFILITNLKLLLKYYIFRVRHRNLVCDDWEPFTLISVIDKCLRIYC